ncbi:MAG TPA: L,D-transpeptidase family protein [Acetobacteraceae bacterium]|jgi:L,D-peptidoglycan transpeptidase YkuD (ErfK/YbiS/YcfS/YnhG family)
MRALVHPDGRLELRGMVFRATLGRAGVAEHKEEGDGATPAGLLPLRRVLYRADRLRAPECAVPIEPIAETDGWCDDPSSREYNRMIRLPHDAHHEELWRTDPLYDLVGVLGWNDSPAVRGQGSAIFLHVARPDYAPTEGCIALALPDLLRVLASGVTELLVG